MRNDPQPEAGTATSGLEGPARRVVLVGNYGSANLGDELLLRVISGWVREAGGLPVAISVNPDYTRNMHGTDAVHYADPAAMARAVGEADLLLLAGGGLLQDYDTLHEDALGTFPAFGATQFVQHTMLAGTLGVPVVALAQGVGPLRDPSARRLARGVFDNAFAASVRDDASAALLREIGCERSWPVAPDPAWVWSAGEAPLEPAVVDPVLAGRPVLAVVLRDWPFDPAWEDQLVEALAGALPSGWACLWIDFHRHPREAVQRSAFVQRVTARLPGIHVEWTGQTFEEATRLMAGSDAVLAMRLHALLLAGSVGRPLASIEYDHKVTALADSMGVPARQRVPLDAVATRLPAAIEAICGPAREHAFRLDSNARGRLASAAMLHRDVLLRAIASSAPLPHGRARPKWLSRWSQGEGGVAAAFVDTLETRLHALQERLHASEAERERLWGEAQQWQARHAAIERSRSYRITAPLRMVAGRLRDARARTPRADGVAGSVSPPPLPGIELLRGRRVDIINVNFFDWHGAQVYNGGAERYVLDLVSLCRRMGLEPRLMQNAYRAFERDYQGVEVIGLPLSQYHDLAQMSRAYAAHVADAALVIASPVELAAGLQRRHGVIGINHGIHWDWSWNTIENYSPDRDTLLFDALRQVDACVCVDTNFINWVRCHDWQRAQVLDYIPNYVDTGAFTPGRKDFDAPRLVVLYPRRLYKPRGFQDAMEACEGLLARGLPIDVHFCGAADDAEARLARDFVGRHPGRARWFELPMSQMQLAYRDSHIVLIPTNFAEGTSLSCIEAMATRNGIVATTVGGLPNLILDGFNGLLVKPGADALAGAIERLVADRALLAALAENALRVVPSLARARWERQWIEVLARVAGRAAIVSQPPADALSIGTPSP